MHGNLVIVTNNRQGAIADVLYILSSARMHVEQISGVVNGDDAVISIDVKDPARVKKMLEANGYSVIFENNTVVATVLNSLDEKAKIFSELATHKVKITDFKEIANLKSHSVFALSVDKVATAKRVLSPNLLTNFDFVSLA